MKKFALVLTLFLALFTMTACEETDPDPDPNPEPIEYTVTFNTDGGSSVDAQTVEEGQTATAPADPTKEGYDFILWYTTDDTVEFDFSTPITADLTINAYWQEIIPEKTNEDYIDEDIAWFEGNLIVSPTELDLPNRGQVNRSSIEWESNSVYISNDGIVVPLPKGSEASTGTITANFTYKGTEKSHTFEIPLVAMEDVVIDNVVNYPFENLTTEYDVADATVDLYFEENGSVPYISVVDFFDLVVGFIDPEVVFTVDTTDGVLTMEYDYYDEDEDQWYDLILTIDSLENTINVNDPGFYWAYTYSTETNYGRHIEYDFDNPNASFDEGDEIVYDLDDYNMDVVMCEGDL